MYAIFFSICIAVKRIGFTIEPILYMTALHTSLGFSSPYIRCQFLKYCIQTCNISNLTQIERNHDKFRINYFSIGKTKITLQNLVFF